MHGSPNSNLENGIKLLGTNNLEKANQTPQTSNIEDYENIINPVCRQGRQ